MSLTSKERMQLMMDHKEPDRVPYQVTFVPELNELFRKKYSEELKDIKFTQKEKWKSMTELDILFGHDMVLLTYGISNSYYSGNIDSETYIDNWGITWKKISYNVLNGKGYYTEIIDSPLSDDDKIDSYVPPNPDDEDMEYAEEIINKYGNEYYICGNIECSIFEALKYLRGMTKALVDLVANKDIAHKIMDISVDYHLKLGLKLVEKGVDIIFFAEDVAGEDSLLIAPNTFREMIKSKLGYMIGELKRKNKNIKISFHSDGNVEPLIDDLIEVGVDLLNPIQPEAMNPAHIKRRYGNKLALWGAVSTQRTFPFGSAKDVENEVRELIKDCGLGGGFLIAPNNSVQLDVPLENIQAFYNAVKKYGKYPIKIP